MPISIEAILSGTGVGRLQSVGQMSVIPLISQGEDCQDFAPPGNVDASTHDYGAIRVQNRANRPTIIPTGTGWVTKQMAQDHAVGGAALVKANQHRVLDTASCIQQSQGGLIHGETTFIVMPADLRGFALAMRNEKRRYDKMWPYIHKFNEEYGVSPYRDGNLVSFLKRFEKELDQFVAEFELVPDQIGAIVMIGGRVVGIERAPSVEFWQTLWTPLIRVCYGSLAIKASLLALPPTRMPLIVKTKSLIGISDALEQAAKATIDLRDGFVSQTKAIQMEGGAVEDSLSGYGLMTAASNTFAGQILLDDPTGKGSANAVYASICATS